MTSQVGYNWYGTLEVQEVPLTTDWHSYELHQKAYYGRCPPSIEFYPFPLSDYGLGLGSLFVPVTFVNRSSDSIAEYRRQRATCFTPTLYSGFDMFFVRRNKGTSRSIVLNTLPPACDKTPLTSKQDADISPTVSIQCFTSALFSETRFDHVLCSPKQGHVSLHCTPNPSPLPTTKHHRDRNKTSRR